MAKIFRNFLAGQISDNPLTSGATTVNSPGFANLPVVSTPDTMAIVLDPLAAAGAPEIIIVTAHTASATAVTCTRGQEGTTARSHNLNTVWRHAATQVEYDGLPYRLVNAKGDLLVATADKTITRVAAGTNDHPLIADSAQAAGVKWGQLQTAGIGDKQVTGPKMLPALCQVNVTGGQNVNNNATTAIPFGGEVLDPLGWHDNVTNNTRVTPTIAGYYQTYIAFTWSSDTDYTRLIVEPFKNGAALSSTYRWDSGTITAGSHSFLSGVIVSPLIVMNGTTDYFEAAAFQQNTSAGASTITSFMLVKLVYPT